MKRLLILLALGAAALTFGQVRAHGTAKPEHGGVVQMVGETAFELVALADGADVYLSEEGEALGSEGMTGKLTVTVAGAKSEAALLPSGGNRLTAKGVKIAGGAKVNVMLTRSDQSRLNATFSIK